MVCGELAIVQTKMYKCLDARVVGNPSVSDSFQILMCAEESGHKTSLLECAYYTVHCFFNTWYTLFKVGMSCLPYMVAFRVFMGGEFFTGIIVIARN